MMPSSSAFIAFNIDTLLTILSNVAVVGFVIYIVVLFVLTLTRQGLVLAFLRLISAQVLIPFTFTLGIVVLGYAVNFIQPAAVAVVISALSPDGIRQQPLRAGLHVIIPFLEQVQLYPIYYQTYTMSNGEGSAEDIGDDSIRARTKDGQEVRLSTSTIFRIDVNQVTQVHVDWQDRYIDDLIRPLVRGFVRTEVSKFTVNEVNSSSRAELEATLERLLREELTLKGFELDQFLIRDITFSVEYAASVEAKQVAKEQQEAALFQAEREIRLARGDATATEIRALAQANAAREIGKALQESPEVLTYYYIDKISPNVRVMLLPSENPLILPLPDDLVSDTSTNFSASPLDNSAPFSLATPIAPSAFTPLDGAGAQQQQQGFGATGGFGAGAQQQQGFGSMGGFGAGEQQQQGFGSMGGFGAGEQQQQGFGSMGGFGAGAQQQQGSGSMGGFGAGAQQQQGFGSMGGFGAGAQQQQGFGAMGGFGAGEQQQQQQNTGGN